jgi:hypothetical protein
MTRKEFRPTGAITMRRWSRVMPKRSECAATSRRMPAHLSLAAAQSAARDSEPDVYDGQAELWWDSLGDVVAAVSTSVGQHAATEPLEDERKFIDLEQSPLWIGEERAVVET